MFEHYVVEYIPVHMSQCIQQYTYITSYTYFIPLSLCITLYYTMYTSFSTSLVCNDQVPDLALGLSPPDCPLNVMVGTWPRCVHTLIHIHT